MADAKEKVISLMSSTASCDLNAAAGTEKELYTVPAGKKLIVDHLAIHTLSANAASAVVTFGKTGGTCDEWLGDQTLSGLDGTTKVGIIRPVPAATPTAQVLFTAAQVFAMEITTAAGSGSTATIEVWGHLIAA